MSHQPPKLAQRLLRWFCRLEFLEEVEFDLEELFAEQVGEDGLKAAKRSYWRNVLRHLRPFFLRNPLHYQSQNSIAMWSNYVKIAFRNFWKNKVISAINVLGLSFGLASCLIVFFHIKDELSYDQFLENGDQIYRVLNYYPSDESPYSAGGPIPLGPALEQDLAGVQSAVRLWRDYQPTLQVGTNVFSEHDLVFTDPNFFKTFSFPLLQGNPETVLDEPNTVVLTQQMAKKYFGDQDPLGKTIEYRGARGTFEMKVTGVMRDLPHNTHFEFDFLASFLSVTRQLDNWGSYKPIWTYITLEPGMTIDALSQGFPDFMQKYVPDRVEESPGYTYALEPVSEIYMKSKADRNMKPLGDIQSVYVLALVGISILLIACINFINLSMARALARAREVGVRKTIGARKGQVVVQFITESGLTVLLSVLVALVLSYLFLPVYNEVTGKPIAYSSLFSWDFVVAALLLMALVALFAGLYPALFVSRFKASTVVKRGTDKAGAKLGIRKLFVVFQFLISATLVIGVLITRDQMTYLYTKPLGINKENVLVIPSTANEQVVLAGLKAMPEVQQIAYSQRMPVNTLNYDGRTFKVEGSDEWMQAQSCIIDLEYLETYGIQLISGRDHFKEKTDQWEFLINESAVEAFGFGNPEAALGKKIFWSPEYQVIGPVIGVVKDYHLESLHEKIPPMVMFRNIDEDQWQRNYISIRYKTDDLPSFLFGVEDLWTEHNPKRAYQSFLISDSFRELHEADHRFAKIFNYVVVLAMLIACLGLLGLSMLTVTQKEREIGIRKVLGASVGHVVTLLSSSFMKLILAGLVLAVPLAYFFMDSWLAGFSYRIDIGLKPFLLALLITIMVSMFTISFQTLSAALGNPADALRNE